MKVHLMAATHAKKEGDQAGCGVKGTHRVTTNSFEVTCTRCIHWYNQQPMFLSAQGQVYIDSLGGAQ